MKIKFFLILLPLFVNPVYSQIMDSTKIKWFSIEEADSLVKIKPKKIFIDVYTDWCGWCKVMDQQTFTNPVIAKYLNQKFYPVKFNAEIKKTIKCAGQKFENRGRTHDLAFALLGNEIGYPSTVYLTEKLELLYKRSGFIKPQELEPILIYLGENIYQEVTWENFLKTFISKIEPPQNTNNK